MDVSDGLLGDLGKLCAASSAGACLDLDRLPISDALARRHSPADCERFILYGGDDYELLFTLPADEALRIEAELSPGCAVHRIGSIEAGAGVRCVRDGRELTMPGGGYDHFG